MIANGASKKRARAHERDVAKIYIFLAAVTVAGPNFLVDRRKLRSVKST